MKTDTLQAALADASDVVEARLRAQFPDLTRLLEAQTIIIERAGRSFGVYECGDWKGFYGTQAEANEARRALIMHALLKARAELESFGAL